jgi:hypothetical protein
MTLDLALIWLHFKFSDLIAIMVRAPADLIHSCGMQNKPSDNLLCANPTTSKPYSHML